MKLSFLFALVHLALGVLPTVAAEFRADNAAAFASEARKLQPGDTLVLGPGEWRDADLLIEARGTPEKYIFIKAAQPGVVRLTGSSQLRIGGSHLCIEGLWFQDAQPASGEIIALRRDSKRLATACVLRNCAITQSTEHKQVKEMKWLSLYGTNHLVEGCHFEGKTTKGTLLVVWLDEGGQAAPPHHHIIANYFGARPRLGKNGGEIIRIGDSSTSMQSAACVVARNYFEHCDGETECISNKSCDNLYRGNSFSECQGTLTLRHGNRCTVEGNWFSGNGVKYTGGIRIIGEDHRVTDNRLQDLQGDGARAAICLMNGIENTPAHGYVQVRRALVSGNVILRCKESLALGYGDEDVKATMPPLEVRVEDNVFVSPQAKIFHVFDPRAQVTWKGNAAWGKEPGMDLPDGVVWREAPPSAVPANPPAQREGTGVSWTCRP